MRTAAPAIRSRAGLDLLDRDHSSTSVAGAGAAGAGDRQLGGGQVLDGEPERAEHRHRLGAAAPRVGTRSRPRRARRECGPGRRSRPRSSASRYSPASLAADSRLSTKSSAAAIVATSSSRADGMLAPTALTWAPSREPVALEHRLARVGGGDDHVGAGQRLARARAGLEGDPVTDSAAAAATRLGACSAFGEWIRTRGRSARTSISARRCAAAWTPEPRIASARRVGARQQPRRERASRRRCGSRSPPSR